jgi:protein-L-isoaspartate(D-aspartate) O-methyltransferase
MAQDMEKQRQHLIESLRKNGITDERMLAAVADTPREMFLHETQSKMAYEDRALSIGLGQTISQPLIVATMTQALHLVGNERVLEIGTGSGYQTAILARLAGYVYSVERFQQLACLAFKRLEKLGYSNVSVLIGDGSLGWPDQAPYDCILVTAAAPEVSEHLYKQLGLWGKMVIPVGGQERQELFVVRCTPWGPEKRSLGGCIFVPLVGAAGWNQ